MTSARGRASLLGVRVWSIQRRRLVEDAALAAAVAAVGQVEVWAPELVEPNLVGPRPAIASFYAFTALVLVARRARPFAVLAIIAIVDVLHFVSLGASEGMGALLPLLVATYSVAANCDRRPALAGLALGIVVAVVHELTNPDNTDFAAVFDAAVWDLTVVAAWLAGAYLRTRRLYVAELGERAARAEREREEGARAAATAERSRIARELHDVISHSVSVIVVQSEAAAEVLDREPDQARRALGRIQTTGRDALLELRRLLGVLKEEQASPSLAPQPGMDDLDRLIAQVREAGLPVGLDVVGDRVALPPGLDLAAYRVVQEALTNALKHAGPASAHVLVTYGEDELAIDVLDDGTGASGSNGGHGLDGMRERVALYGGELEAGSAAGGGYRVSARLPLGRPQ